MASNNAYIAHVGVHSAWFTKAKHDGAKTKWLGNATVRRLFTIDFDKKVLFYRHSESERSTSNPIPFSGILGATRPNDRTKLPLGSHLSMHKSLSTSLLKLAPNCVEYPIIIHTSDRRIRLNADTEAQARAWVEALNAAHRIGKGHVPKPIVTQNAPAWTTGSKLACRNISPSMSSNATESTMDGEGSEEADAIGEQSPTASEASPIADLQLSSQLLPDESSDVKEEEGATASLEPEAEVVQLGSSGLRAADFGFDEEFDGDACSECASSAPSTPRLAEAAAGEGSGAAATSPEPCHESDSEDEDVEDASLQKTLEHRRAADLRLATAGPSRGDLFQKMSKPALQRESAVIGSEPTLDDDNDCRRMSEDLRLLDGFGCKPCRRPKKGTRPRSGSNPEEYHQALRAERSERKLPSSKSGSAEADRAARDLELLAKQAHSLQTKAPQGFRPAGEDDSRSLILNTRDAW